MPKAKTKRKAERISEKQQLRLRERKQLAQAARERRRRIRQWLYLGVAAVVALLVIGSFVVSALPGRGGPSPSGQEVGTRVPLLAANHLPEGTAVTTYNSTPPTSGPHYAVPANWGIYDRELLDEQIVHNLEHAGVVISYNLDDQGLVNQLKEIVDSYPRQCYLVLRPYSKIDKGKVALTAWGWIDTMDGVDRERIRKFIDAWRGNGANAPELPPC